MLNQVILVGTLIDNPKLTRTPDGRKKIIITLAIQRGFKNAESGEYDTDNIKCVLWSGIAENTVEYCKKGATVGVKARLQQSPNGVHMEVIAEKITFINTKQDED